MGWHDEEEIQAKREFQEHIYIDKMSLVFARACDLLDEVDRDLTIKEAVAEALLLLGETERQTRRYEEARNEN
jgi:hypothetical protein